MHDKIWPSYVSCRPCKAFMATYHQFAERFADSVLLEVTGDENPELRKLMKTWEVKVRHRGCLTALPQHMAQHRDDTVNNSLYLDQILCPAFCR